MPEPKFFSNEYEALQLLTVRRMAGGAKAFPSLSLVFVALILLLFTSGCRFRLYISLLSSLHTEIL